MAVPFGLSIGDFIAGISLIITCVQSVRDAGGSLAKYVALVSQLESVKAALTAIDALKLELTAQEKYNAIYEAIKRCHLCVETFVASIAKYQRWLQPSKQGWKTSLRKIQWAFCKKKDIEEFRDQMAQLTSSINMLMSSLQVRLGLGQTKLQQKCYAMIEATHETAKELPADAVESHNVIEAFSVQQASYFQQLRLNSEHLVDQVRRFENSNENLVKQVAGLRNTLLLQQQIPPQVLLQKPVQFLDACGNLSSFHLDFITCAEALIAVLRIRFQQNGVTPKGVQKLDKFEFVLRDRSTELSLHAPWQAVFKPGQNVDMSMVFFQAASVNKCPGCSHEDDKGKSGDVDCSQCGLQYRCVTTTTCETSVLLESLIEAVHILDALEDQPIPEPVAELHDFRRVQINLPLVHQQQGQPLAGRGIEELAAKGHEVRQEYDIREPHLHHAQSRSLSSVAPVRHTSQPHYPRYANSSLTLELPHNMHYNIQHGAYSPPPVDVAFPVLIGHRHARAPSRDMYDFAAWLGLIPDDRIVLHGHPQSLSDHSNHQEEAH
ncbi:hypothetical protein MMC18_008560 [Xylographa bjoerkii]|nr:hypothetical protein [Xylographa bjoerkii]